MLAVSVLFALTHSHHSSGGGFSGGSSGGSSRGDQGGHSHAHKPYTKHLVATSAISSYLIWGTFSNAVYNNFMRTEDYNIYNLYYYNEFDNCLYYTVYKNENNETKIDGNSLIFVNLDSNEVTNTSNNFKVEIENYYKFCERKDNSSGNIMFMIVILILLICYCCWSETSTNRNMY